MKSQKCLFIFGDNPIYNATKFILDHIFFLNYKQVFDYKGYKITRKNMVPFVTEFRLNKAVNVDKNNLVPKKDPIILKQYTER